VPVVVAGVPVGVWVEGFQYVRGNCCPLRTSLLAYMIIANPICLRLLAHFTRLACSRARFRAGRRIEISSAMIPMTTNSSTRVKPLEALRSFIKKLLSNGVLNRAGRSTIGRSDR